MLGAGDLDARRAARGAHRLVISENDSLAWLLHAMPNAGWSAPAADGTAQSGCRVRQHKTPNKQTVQGQKHRQKHTNQPDT